MAYEAGTAFLQIQPSFSGVVTAISAKAQKWGDEAGLGFSSSFKDTVQRSTKDTQVGPSDTESSKRGEASGGKFADAFKTRLDAALKALPDATVNLNDKTAQTKIANLRARMLTLRDLTIGVDISSTDALAAIEVIRLDLDALAKKSPDIRVKVDAADALAKLEAIKIASDRTSGDKSSGIKGLISSFSTLGTSITDLFSSGDGGIKGVGTAIQGVGSSLGSVGSAGPYAAIGVGLLATALIPVAALAAGAAIGLTGMAVAATAGIGAFGLAVLPVLKNVSQGVQTLNADQIALNRALTPAAKKTALGHMYLDLQNMSPVVRTISAGIINAWQQLQDWSAQFSPQIITAFNAGLSILSPLLTAISPLARAGGDAVKVFFSAIAAAVSSPGFQGFTTWLATQVGPAVASFAKTFIGFGKGFAHLLENSGPLIQAVEKFLPKMVEAFDKAATSKSFKDFVQWITKNGPGIFNDVKAIIVAIVDIIVALAPVGLFVLRILGDASTAFTNFQHLLAQVWTDIYHVIVDAWHWIYDNALSPLENAMSGMGRYLNEAKQNWDTAWGDIKKSASDTYGWMKSNVFDPIGSVLTNLGLSVGDFKQTWSDAWGVVQTVVATVAATISGIIAGITSAINGVRDAVNWLNGGATAGTYPTPKSPITGRPTPGRAAGGPVLAGHAYRVGELAPETFVPAVDGTILNHHQLNFNQPPRSGPGLAIAHASFHNEADIDVLTRKADFAMASGRL
jgi:phage-related protein